MNIENKITHYINKISEAIYFSSLEQSSINDEILNLTGMSSPKIRHFLNKLCQNLDINYLEVGSFQGSTLCSALFNNKINKAFAFENFSEFSDQQDKIILLSNIKKFKNETEVNLIEDDFFNYQLDNIKNIDIYFYDGVHTINHQYWHFNKIKNSLSDVSIILVDDWFCQVSKPKEASLKAIRDFGFNVHLFCELPKNENNVLNYHGGLGVFVVSKK